MAATENTFRAPPVVALCIMMEVYLELLLCFIGIAMQGVAFQSMMCWTLGARAHVTPNWPGNISYDK